MSDQPVDATTPTTDVPVKKKRRRIFLWFFLAVQAIFIVWIIAGLAGSNTPVDCGGDLSAEACKDAANVGTGLGLVLVVVLWMVVDFFIALGYGIYRLARRP